MIQKVFILLFFILSISIKGQIKKNGIIYGMVLNSNNNSPVEFASIAVYGTTIGAISDTSGNFEITGLEPGFTELRVTCIGYDPFVSAQIMVTNANKTYIEIPLTEIAKQINEVVVKASPFRRDKESPLSLRNISLKEIEKSPGSNRDISKVIQTFPGVASTPSYRNDVIVRGGGSSENRFYLDGVEIPNLNHFATQGASGGPAGIINVDFIREVNFYSGAFPAEKSNALSSILDMKQIEGNREKLKTKASIGASDMALTLDGPVFDNTTFILSARRSYLEFLFKLLELPFLPVYNDVQFKVNTKLNQKNEISLIGLGAYDVNKLNLDANETESQRYILGYLPENDQWNYTLGIVYKHFYQNSYDTWVLSRNMLNNKQIKYINNEESPENKILDYDSFESENKIRYEHNRQIPGGLKIAYGLNGEYARYYNNTFRKAFNGNDYYTSDISFFKWGAFGQISKDFINKRLVFSIGARTDANNYSSKMANMLTQFSPRFSGSFALTRNININFNTGKYYQLPSYTTLGYSDSIGIQVNKATAKYISADHLVAGIDYQPNTESKLSLEGFLKYYTNYPFSTKDSISLASKGTDFGTYGDEAITSNGVGRAYGLEVLYQNKDLFGTNITVSYTFVRSEFKDASGNYVPSSWDNKHLLNILATKQFKYHWIIGAKWRFVGGAPYTPVDIEKSSLVGAWDIQKKAYPDYSKYNSLRFEPYHQLDIRVDKEFFFNKWSLIAYLDIQNIYNYKSQAASYYVVDQNIPVSPNPDRYTLKEIESTSGGTILPSIGIIVQF